MRRPAATSCCSALTCLTGLLLMLLLPLSAGADSSAAHASGTQTSGTPAFGAQTSGSQASGAAYTALLHGHLADASTLLHQILSANSSDAHAHQLLCRTNLAEEQPDDAIAECLLAAQTGPRDAATQDWLGRAFGQKASHTNPIAAYKLAARVRESFAQAVTLDPRNAEAVSDLAEFYIFAPGIAGGDTAAARKLASGLLPFAPARAHRLFGLLAQSNNDRPAAESEFRQAVAAGNTPEAWNDLAIYYDHIHQPDLVLTTVRQALALDVRHGPVEVDAATILTSSKRAPDLAERALRAYLASPNETDEAPAPRVHVLLGRLLASRGDHDGARAEFKAALTLAPRYEAARKALDSL